MFRLKSFNSNDFILKLMKYLRLLFVLATEHTLMLMFLNIWSQILFPGDLHDDALQNFCIIEYGTLNCSHLLEQLPVNFT